MDDLLPGLTIETVDGVIVAVGEIDAHTADRLEAQLASLPPEAPVVVDLAGVSFMDSSGLRVLIDAYQNASASDVPFTLRNPSRAVERLLEISGMAAHLQVERT